MIMIDFFANNHHFQEKSKEKFLNIFLILLSAILCIRDIADIGINQFIILALMLIPLAVLSYSQVIYYACFICVIIKGINSFILLPVLFLLLNNCPKKKTIQFLPAIILLIIELLDSLKYIEIKDYILYSLYMLTFFFLMFEKSNRIDFHKCLKYICYGLLLTLFITSVRVLKDPFALLAEGTAEYRGAMGFVEGQDVSTHFVLNANELAYYSVFLVSLLALGYKKLQINRNIFIVAIIVSIGSGLLSQSRTWIIISAFVFITCILVSKLKRKISLAVISLIFCATAIYLFDEYIVNAFNNITDRFTKDNIETAGNRTVLFEEYNDFLLDNPEYLFYGTGALYYKEFAKVSNSTHNATQQIILCYGLLGFIIYIYVSVYFLRNYRARKLKIIDYIPLFATIAFVQSIQFLNPYHLMLPVALSTFSLRISANK